ncbi:hypothetical protein [Marinomonas sp. THO17]|uniref:hypothetical protein n=1 Tax=Marinomonas sp. THO17 TaxID=3149048 RepID=UPI00336BBE4E
MRGNTHIMNSADDFQQASMTREEAIAAATVVVQQDMATYPEEYDHSLSKGKKGYIAPEYRAVAVMDQAVLERFGIRLTEQESEQSEQTVPVTTPSLSKSQQVLGQLKKFIRRSTTAS